MKSNLYAHKALTVAFANVRSTHKALAALVASNAPLDPSRAHAAAPATEANAAANAAHRVAGYAAAYATQSWHLEAALAGYAQGTPFLTASNGEKTVSLSRERYGCPWVLLVEDDEGREASSDTFVDYAEGARAFEGAAQGWSLEYPAINLDALQGDHLHFRAGNGAVSVYEWLGLWVEVGRDGTGRYV